MTQSEFDALSEGNIVQLVCRGEAYIVHANYGARVTVVRTRNISNIGEWRILTGSTDRPISELHPGDILCDEGGTPPGYYVITAIFGDHAIGVSATEITKADLNEWKLIRL
jgi:hypothetical protein